MGMIARGQNNGLYVTAMPAWGDVLSTAEIRGIVAYLKTWWTPDELAVRERWFGLAGSNC